jgi:hypothetical protein
LLFSKGSSESSFSSFFPFFLILEVFFASLSEDVSEFSSSSLPIFLVPFDFDFFFDFCFFSLSTSELPSSEEFLSFSLSSGSELSSLSISFFFF